MGLTEEGIIEVEGMSSQWVRLPNGAKAHYMTSGTTGPAVLLLHGGLPGSSGTAGWRFMAPFLGANGFRVYAPDMPGFGLSDTRPEHQPTTLASHADFIHEFVTALALEKFHIAGNSMGCINTVNYVVAHPERILSFALIAGDIGDVQPLTDRPGPKIIPSWEGTREGMRSLMASIIYREEAIGDDLVEMRYLAATRHKATHEAFWPSILEYDRIIPWRDANTAARLVTKGRLDTVTLPGIYLYGTEDVLTPVEWGYEQEKALPNVQFFYPEECGHQGQTDRPDLFNPVFLEFFRDGKVSRRTADAAGVSKRRPELTEVVEQP
ncbi:alpha/beta hydrolase [Actinomadura madurae]|uniref:alpha/beta fold hydrolase n=1 Tax=Actinomadura madurae TaxID=1993 RepID=UPI00399BADE1